MNIFDWWIIVFLSLYSLEIFEILKNIELKCVGIGFLFVVLFINILY